jgi:5-methyltetrahydropteroyltriglutamate--homocysteine methyltransferase
MSVSTRAIPRAEQVGSLKRSDRLVAANEAVYAPGHVAIEASERAHGLDALYAVAEEETRRVVQRQLEIGLDVVTDGEFRRYMFLNSLFDGITGFSSEVSKARFKAADGSAIEWNMQYVVDRLEQVDSPAAREASIMSGLTDQLYKVTFPAGSFLALPYNFKAEINGHAYESHRRLVEHVVHDRRRRCRGMPVRPAGLSRVPVSL